MLFTMQLPDQGPLLGRQARIPLAREYGIFLSQKLRILPTLDKVLHFYLEPDYTPLLAHIPVKGQAQNFIELSPVHVNLTVNYEAEWLFPMYLGDTTYTVPIGQAASCSVKHLYVSATGHDGDDVYCYIGTVNTSDSPVGVALEITHGLAGLGVLPP